MEQYKYNNNRNNNCAGNVNGKCRGDINSDNAGNVNDKRNRKNNNSDAAGDSNVNVNGQRNRNNNNNNTENARTSIGSTRSKNTNNKRKSKSTASTRSKNTNNVHSKDGDEVMDLSNAFDIYKPDSIDNNSKEYIVAIQDQTSPSVQLRRSTRTKRPVIPFGHQLAVVTANDIEKEKNDECNYETKCYAFNVCTQYVYSLYLICFVY